MQIPTFILERSQTLHENEVRINLTESGVHPATIRDILSDADLAELAALPLGYGYTDGRPSLRQAAAAWYPGAAAENVLVAHGTSEANLLTLMALAERGDHIIIIVPNFMQIDGLARSLGVEVTQVALRPGDGWQPDITELELAIRPQTKLITLCDPNNPTGTTLTRSSRQALADVSDRTGVWLHVDEIYRGSEIDGVDAPTMYGMGKRVIVTGGLSKSFGCPGLRMGWMIGPQTLVAQGHRLQDYTSIGTGVVSQFVAERVLCEPVRSRLLSRGRHILKAGRRRVSEWLGAHNGWSWVVPQASGMAFLRYDMDIASETFVDGLRRAKSVLVCAGSWFGIEGYIRVGFGVDPHHLESGLVGIDEYLSEVRSFN
jgi:aspartate/methionine/tyrosine aminotransferase